MNMTLKKLYGELEILEKSIDEAVEMGNAHLALMRIDSLSNLRDQIDILEKIEQIKTN
jgi:hypothetical protein